MDERDIEIDENIVKSLKNWVVIQESNNLKTRKYSDSKMVEIIKKRIEEEVRCSSNQ